MNAIYIYSNIKNNKILKKSLKGDRRNRVKLQILLKEIKGISGNKVCVHGLEDLIYLR
jgi:hypothetical protein